MTPTLGVILAGGLARRMGGGDKALREVGGQTVLARLIARFGPQVARLIINANGDPARFAPTGLPVVADGVAGFPGPLAGVLAGLDWADAHGLAWIATVPGDAPFVPTDLVARLHDARTTAGMTLACAASGGRVHPVVAVWPTSIRGTLRQALEDGARKVETFAAGLGLATALWPGSPLDPFFNVNTPEDLAEADRLVAAGG